MNHIKYINKLIKYKKIYFRNITYNIGNDSNFGKEIKKIRNIGVFAHIDAGKTTTTERMLYYAGLIRSMGEVHHGNTVTDYMDQERERGITIRSAAVTFKWNDCYFNLIDTPGHIDFTMEVEQSLNVLDGAIIIIDGSAGVEAQTLTVWRQADRYKIPRIIYMNKMDKPNSDFRSSLKSISEKLKAHPLPLQIPLYEQEKLIGVSDLISLTNLIWNKKNQGQNYKKEKIEEEFLVEVLKERNHLLEHLADHDDIIAESIINQGSFEQLSPEEIKASLRRIALSNKGVPVICGSSYKNTGVQPLMDAIIEYLPSPDERNKNIQELFHNKLCAKAFKIIHDERKRPITFFRIYSGSLTKGQKLYNVNQEKQEQIGKLTIPFAEELKEMSEIPQGNIAAIFGLKFTQPGNFVTDKSNTANMIRKEMNEGNNIILDTKIPDPVFFCSIEISSQAYQNQFEQALQELQKEDPSLKVNFESETGQTILGGMGELHLEIIKNRLINEYKLDVDLGPLYIAYKETITEKISDSLTLDTKIASNKQYVKLIISLVPNTNENQELLTLDRKPENASNLASLSFKHLKALNQGLTSALNRGPKMNYPMFNVRAILHWFETTRGTSDSLIASTMSKCVEKMLKDTETYIMEPIMYLEIVVPEDYLSMILSDLSNRRSSILKITPNFENKVLECLTPLSNLLGYASDLRTISSGRANFAMEFHSYKMLSLEDEKNLLTTQGLFKSSL